MTAGPEWKIRRGKRFAPFAQALAGIVYTRSTFMMSGSDVRYSSPFTGGVLLFFFMPALSAAVRWRCTKIVAG